MATLDKVSVDLMVVLGTTTMPIHQVMRLSRGAIIELEATEEDEVTILANCHIAGTVIRKGARVVDLGRSEQHLALDVGVVGLEAVVPDGAHLHGPGERAAADDGLAVSRQEADRADAAHHQATFVGSQDQAERLPASVREPDGPEQHVRRGLTSLPFDGQAGAAGVLEALEARLHKRGQDSHEVIRRRLVAAGLRTRQDLATWTREQLLALPGLSEFSFQRCLAVLDQPLASSVRYWTARNVPWPTAWRLSRERIMTVADLRRYRVDHLVKLGFRPLEAQCLLSLAAKALP